MGPTTIVFVVGRMITGLAAAMVFCAVVGFFYGERQAAFGLSMASIVTAFFGVGLTLATRGWPRRGGGRRDAVALAIASWIALPPFAALPFLFSGAIDVPLAAWVEAVSGITTTGATVMTNLDMQDRAILLWRAVTQWFGGLMTIVLGVSLIGALAVGASDIGLSHLPRGENDTLFGGLRSTFQAVWGVYAGLTAACAAALTIAGMPPFDALCFALSTLSTGGFSTRDGGLGAFALPAVEVILALFMTIAALNFTFLWALAAGRRRVWKRDIETTFVVGGIAVSALAIAAAFWLSGAPMSESVRQGLVSAASGLSTTGYVPAGAETPPIAVAIIFGWLVLIGPATGTTAGGFKVVRLRLLFRLAQHELSRLAHPHQVRVMSVGGSRVDARVVNTTWAIFAIFLLSAVIGTIVMGATGLEFASALGLTVAAITNSGAALGPFLGEGVVFAELNAISWIATAIGMTLGRLELLVLLIVLSPEFWRS